MYFYLGAFCMKVIIKVIGSNKYVARIDPCKNFDQKIGKQRKRKKKKT